ncbi:sulfite exporter TauE/SafE family protein [Aestuariibacter sp. P117]|uniref:Probable membrane transporter protein n=1 Tax=Glaciecola petra TaxID=3075602 RepID=A0ABU2ZQ64_9ALTE|nr:sulfite exporter TauE/SafE family protein [Aestuariibacter sp. P117]MDT0594768.1 sulfite exporter TauE/SafE family protein [Aestuariibacter sp. P117]
MLRGLFSLFKKHPIKCVLLTVWIGLLCFNFTLAVIIDYVGFTILGVIGAIFANATGAGGGVVFVPFFNQLSLSSETIVATSFAIQCCGMTAGAITWYWHYRNLPDNKEWSPLPKALLYIVPSSIVGILIAQYALGDYTSLVQDQLHVYFGIFSIVLAIAIYLSIPLMKREAIQVSIQKLDILALILTAILGGVITAWLSVGVGELVAVYLILRGFNVTFAIALAVMVSAFSVQAAIFYHILISNAVYWQIVAFAGAGAIIGGMLAKYVVLYFSPAKLKVFFASWVLVMGIAGLPLFS